MSLTCADCGCYLTDFHGYQRCGQTVTKAVGSREVGAKEESDEQGVGWWGAVTCEQWIILAMVFVVGIGVGGPLFLWWREQAGWRRRDC